MKEQICKCCGAKLPLTEDGAVSVQCEYCRTNYRLDDEGAAVLERVIGQVAAEQEKQRNADFDRCVSGAVDAFLHSDLRAANEQARKACAGVPTCPEGRYIIAFCSSISQDGSLQGLRSFLTADNAKRCTHEESERLKRMMLAFPRNLAGVECEAIRFVMALDGEENESAICSFVDAFSPYIIKKQPSSDYLDSEKLRFYGDLARRYSVPKTCFALLSSIKTNPDSPFATNRFDLAGSTRSFLRNYAEPIGEVVHSIKDSGHRQALGSRYEQVVSEYRQKM